MRASVVVTLIAGAKHRGHLAKHWRLMVHERSRTASRPHELRSGDRVLIGLSESAQAHCLVNMHGNTAGVGGQQG